MAASVGEGMLKAAKDAFDSIDTSSLSISGKETIANVLEQALILGGEEGLNQVQGIIGSLKDGELDEFTSAIGSIDWNTIDINTLDELLKDAGVTTDFTSE
jgi:hypothetical protein